MANTRIELSDGAYIHQRSGSKKGLWHLYAYMNGEEIRRSLGTSDADAAKKAGLLILKDARSRQDAGKTAKQHYFSDIAQRYLSEKVGNPIRWSELNLSKAEIEKRKTATARTLQYLIPYFGREIGKHALDKITDRHVRGYAEWRAEQRLIMLAEKAKVAQKRYDDAQARWKTSTRLQSLYPDLKDYLPKLSNGNIKDEVSSTTLNTEYSILKQIFEFAISKDLVSEKNIPQIKYAPIGEQQTRKGFTQEQIILIRECARKRFKEAQAVAVDAYMRRVADDYSPELLPHVRAKLKASGQGWVGDRTAWGRFTMLCVIDILLGTGMRPNTLAGIERWQVGIKGKPMPVPVNLVPGFVLPDEEMPKYIFLGETRKGNKKRKWSIVPDSVAFPAIRMLLAHIGQEPNAKLLEISTHAVNDAFKKVLAECNLSCAPDGVPYSLYDLRHYYITKKLLEGKVSITIIAMNTMTSIQMIERHYNHLRTEMMYDEISS